MPVYLSSHRESVTGELKKWAKDFASIKNNEKIPNTDSVSFEPRYRKQETLRLKRSIIALEKYPGVFSEGTEDLLIGVDDYQHFGSFRGKIANRQLYGDIRYILGQCGGDPSCVEISEDLRVVRVKGEARKYLIKGKKEIERKEI
jgi:hypothetical protein